MTLCGVLAVSGIVVLATAQDLQIHPVTNPLVVGLFNTWTCSWGGRHGSPPTLRIRNKTSGSGDYGPVLSSTAGSSTAYLDFTPRRCDNGLMAKCEAVENGQLKKSATFGPVVVVADPFRPTLQGPGTLSAGEWGTWKCTTDGATHYYPVLRVRFQRNNSFVDDVCPSCVSIKNEKYDDDCGLQIYKATLTMRLRADKSFRLLCTSTFESVRQRGREMRPSISMAITVTAARSPPPQSSSPSTSSPPKVGTSPVAGNASEKYEGEADTVTRPTGLSKSLRMWVSIAGALGAVSVVTCFTSAYFLRRRFN